MEDERHGINHAAIGYYLTRNWFLPEHMCEAVLRHHEYDQLPAGLERSSIEHIALAIAAEWLYLRKLGKIESSQWHEAGAFVLETLGTTERRSSRSWRPCPTYDGRRSPPLESRSLNWKSPRSGGLFSILAEWTGLEPATPGVTGRYSDQLNYHSVPLTSQSRPAAEALVLTSFRPKQGCTFGRLFMMVGAERLELPTFAL